MKMNLHVLVAAIGFLLATTGCKDARDTTPESPVKVAENEVAGTFGEDFIAGKVVSASSFLASYSETQITDTLQTTLQGKVNEVCQAKGCWMTIAAGDGEEMMVKFKDYGFFMPKDISGREVVMHGMAYYQITPVDELRHYAEDAGKSAEEIARITEPKRELRFLADGVKLLTVAL